MIERAECLLEKAKAGEIYGCAMVIDRGGGEFVYSGHGSLVKNPLVGYAAVMKLAAKFL